MSICLALHRNALVVPWDEVTVTMGLCWGSGSQVTPLWIWCRSGTSGDARHLPGSGGFVFALPWHSQSCL